jgi:aromatic ring-opening dioxygenase catalytic subunit (LigB family)
MAQIVGRVALSHGPQLLRPPERWGELPKGRDPLPPERPELAPHLQRETQQAYFERCHEAMRAIGRKIDEWGPDVILVVGDDQHENVFDDNMPPIVVFMGDEVGASLRSAETRQHGGTAETTRYKVDAALARGLVDGLMERGFDPAWSTATRAEYGLGHAFGRPLHFTTPRADYPILPIMLNTYYPPAPSPKRCVQLGQAIASAIDAFDGPQRVVVMASGGLTHIVIDEQLDHELMTALAEQDLDYMAGMNPRQLVAGSSEIRNWIATAAAGDHGGRMVDYVPCYRTPRGIGCAMGFAIWD